MEGARSGRAGWRLVQGLRHVQALRHGKISEYLSDDRAVRQRQEAVSSRAQSRSQRKWPHYNFVITQTNKYFQNSKLSTARDLLRFREVYPASDRNSSCNIEPGRT